MEKQRVSLWCGSFTLPPTSQSCYLWPLPSPYPRHPTFCGSACVTHQIVFSSCPRVCCFLWIPFRCHHPAGRVVLLRVSSRPFTSAQTDGQGLDVRSHQRACGDHSRPNTIAIPSPHPLQMVLGEKSSLDRMPADYGPEVQSSNQAPVFQENVKERLTTEAA